MHGRREETKAVKQALRAAGFENVRAGHGKGTARGWLHVRVRWDQRQPYATQYQAATGRHGDCDGRINVDLVR